MSIKVLYLLKKFYTSPKQISGYTPDRHRCQCNALISKCCNWCCVSQTVAYPY